MLEKIGAVVTAFGIMCADSEILLIPVVIVAIGRKLGGTPTDIWADQEA